MPRLRTCRCHSNEIWRFQCPRSRGPAHQYPWPYRISCQSSALPVRPRDYHRQLARPWRVSSCHSGQMSTKGSLKLSKAVLIAGGSPAGVPAVLNFDTKYDMAKGTGVLDPSTVDIGNAKSHLSGTYKSEGDEFAVDMKLTGEGLPATDLEAFLPALAVNLPQGTKLTAGTLNTNLHITGPTNRLVTDGNIGFFNGKLTGFDLGQKMSGVASLAGIKSGKDLDIEKMTSDVHMAPMGLRADNFNLVVPALGSVVGGGTLDSKNTLDFKLVATVNSSMLGGGASCKNGGIKVPLQIHGTTANPQFTPDIGGATASLMKSELTCAGEFR